MRYDQMCKHRNLSAMTLEHGQLLQDSGFSKLGSLRCSFDSSVRTITRDQIELCYLSGRRMGKSYFGKHATATTRQMVDPSTSASRLTEAECIASIREACNKLMDQIKQSYSPKTSCPPLKWVLPDGLRVTQSWARSSVATPYSYSSLMSTRSRRGSIQTEQVMMLGDQFDQPLDTSASGVPIYRQLKTRSITASGK